MEKDHWKVAWLHYNFNFESNIFFFYGMDWPMQIFPPLDSVSEIATLWCLIEDAHLEFGTTWISTGVLVWQSCFYSEKELAYISYWFSTFPACFIT